MPQFKRTAVMVSTSRDILIRGRITVAWGAQSQRALSRHRCRAVGTPWRLEVLPCERDVVILPGDRVLDKDHSLTWISLPAFHKALIACQKLCAQWLLSEMVCTGNQAANHYFFILETTLRLACLKKNKTFTPRIRVLRILDVKVNKGSCRKKLI